MIETLSNYAIIHAILAINSEIVIQKEYLDSPKMIADEHDEEEELLNDLEQVFMEFIDLYKNRRKKDNQLPSTDELLNSEL